MERKKIRKSKKNGSPKWMVTYSDMITLILVFFILLFSMSQIDLEKFKAITQSFNDRAILDQKSTEKGQENESDVAAPPKNVQEESLEGLLQEVERYLAKNGLNDVITASRTRRGVVLILQERILFASGQADILTSGKPFLNKVGSLLQNIDNQVEVQGHTDSRPIKNYRYPSNWELSGARASSVIRYLIAQGNFTPSRFTAVGYADTRPAAANDSEDNWKKNRRVEIIILKKDAKTSK
ncbi:flagellar motor protein MotS [Virgibacillus halophilus]|uniref:Flagellar motor protein MotS n=1 Tax=Tigheibacillus halophilus TaxID=361280 RepID=A0ABU5CEK2_9BACI|nr:flagellar motor protein MotS [Virgibacillus halophilus]